MPVRATILCQLFYPELVSTGQTLTELGEELVELGVELSVICGPLSVIETRAVPRDLDYRGIRIHRVPGTRFPKLSTPGKFCNLVSFTVSAALRLLFSRSREPLLILTNPPFLAAAGVLAKWLRGRRYIFVVFDVYPDVAVQIGMLRENGLLHRAWNGLNRVLYRNAERVIVLGERMAEIVSREDKLGAAGRKRLRVVHIWCDDRNIRPAPREDSRLLREWGLRDKFLIQYSGNIGRIHDVETIVRAALLLRARPEIHFQFIGEGYKKKWLLAFAERHALSNVSFRGYVPREDLPAALAAASAGIVALDRPFTGMAVPSKLFGVLAAGRPAIAVMEQTSEAGELVLRHNCGVVVEPGDAEGLAAAIRRLADDPGLCAELGQNGAAALRGQYSLRQAALQYKALIEELSDLEAV